MQEETQISTFNNAQASLPDAIKMGVGRLGAFPHGISAVLRPKQPYLGFYGPLP
jgi:hypothetical protein